MPLELTWPGCVVSFDALILPVDPFLQRHSDATNSTAVSNGIAMMKPQAMAEQIKVEQIAITDRELHAIIVPIVPLQRLIHQPFVTGGRCVTGPHFVSCSAVIAKAARKQDLFKITLS